MEEFKMIDLNIGFTLILKEKFKNKELMDMIAYVLALSETHIRVINNYGELCDFPLRNKDKVLVLLSEVGGSFKQLANFSLSEELKYKNTECFVKDICIYSKMECLLPDESSRCDIDMILFLPDGTKKNVYVNSEAMDQNKYIIENYK